MNLAALDAAIKSAGIPIDGVSGTKDTTIQFRPEATDEQRAAAQAILAGWDWSAEAEVKRAEDAHPERTAIIKSAAAALSVNTTFLDDNSPTNAKTLAQVRELTRQNSAVIRRLVQL